MELGVWRTGNGIAEMLIPVFKEIPGVEDA